MRKLCGCDSDANRLRFHNIDICDFDSLENMFKQSPTKFKSCIHFASLKAVGESVEKPLLYYKNNILGVLNMLELLDKYGCNSFVFSSSATVCNIHYVGILLFYMNQFKGIWVSRCPYQRTYSGRLNTPIAFVNNFFIRNRCWYFKSVR